MTQQVQVSFRKADGTIYVLGGATLQEFEANATALLGQHDAQQILGDMAVTFLSTLEHPVDGPSVERHAVAVVQAAVPQAQVVSQQVAPVGQVRTVSDKWGKTYEYGHVDAPTCSHGQMVKLFAVSKSNKPYKGWFCPVSGPEWTGDRGSKCDPHFID